MKNNKWLIFAVLIIIVGGMVMVKINNKPTEQKDIVKDEILTKKTEGVEPTTAEKKVVTVSIVSPEEETFIPGQARMWSAKIENFEDDIGKFGFCEWKFYLNENNQEKLYKEQNIRTVLATGGDNTCGFTSTFIESRGKLRVEVIVLVKDFGENLVETYKAERSYIVQ